MKIRSLRRGQGLTLQSLATAAGLSVSYLSEIEKGKKYPKPERLVALARALGVPFDDLVSLSVPDDLSELKAVFSSGLLRTFPFDLFSLRPEDLLAQVSAEPRRGAALVRAVAEIGRSYDVNVEHFLLAALRAYQQLHGNYFDELETAADDFRARRGWTPGETVDWELLGDALEREWRYRIDHLKLGEQSELAHLRSVFAQGPPAVVYLNPRLMGSQRTFVLAREIGYRALGLSERAPSSPWLAVESFAQVLHNFQASYFAGALLMPRERMRRDLAAVFSEGKWRPLALATLIEAYGVTPETLLHRLTQIAPRFFDLGEFFFFRFSSGEAGSYRLTKWLNTSAAPVPRGFGLSEHYCRRWPALALLGRSAGDLRDPRQESCIASRTRFAEEELEFLEITMARPLALRPGRLSAVTVGFQVGDALTRSVAFADDPSLPRIVVGLTCERCGIEDCLERTATARLREQADATARRAEAIKRLTNVAAQSRLVT